MTYLVNPSFPVKYQGSEKSVSATEAFDDKKSTFLLENFLNAAELRGFIYVTSLSNGTSYSRNHIFHSK